MFRNKKDQRANKWWSACLQSVRKKKQNTRGGSLPSSGRASQSQMATTPGMASCARNPVYKSHGADASEHRGQNRIAKTHPQ